MLGPPDCAAPGRAGYHHGAALVRRSSGDRLGMAERILGNALEEAREHETVEGRHGVPIDAAPQPTGAKAGRLNDQRAVGDWIYRPLEPGHSREAHLGVEHQAVVDFEVFNSPEVHRFAHRKVVGVAAAATEARATGDLIG